MFNNQTLENFDSEIALALQAEFLRQQDHVELIASENYVSPNILALQGSVLTNKYAEGYPGHRYYGGCEHIDVIEQLAINRAKFLFGADYANVQPHSGSQANAAAYMALLKPGDTLLAMDLVNGGHLTHGSPVNFSGKLYRAFYYGLDSNERINYADVLALAKRHRPQVIVAGFSAYARIVDWQCFREIADEVGAYLMVDMSHVAGLVAAECYPSPVAIADVTTTTTHKTLRGPRSGLILAKTNYELEKRLNAAVFPGSQGGPLMHVIAAKALGFKEASQPDFKTYQQQVVKNAKMMASVMMGRGYHVISGGTDNHMFLVSLIDKGITGKLAEAVLGRAHMTVNKNTVPNEIRSPFVTSGLRLGTAAVTTRGFKTDEVATIAHWICDVLEDINNDSRIEIVKHKVLALCQRFPVYAQRD